MSAPGRGPARRSSSRDRQPEPQRVADEVDRRPRWRRRRASMSVATSGLASSSAQVERDLAVDHRRAPAADQSSVVEPRDDERRVDPVEVGVGDDPRGAAVDAADRRRRSARAAAPLPAAGRSPARSWRRRRRGRTAARTRPARAATRRARARCAATARCRRSPRRGWTTGWLRSRGRSGTASSEAGARPASAPLPERAPRRRRSRPARGPAGCGTSSPSPANTGDEDERHPGEEDRLVGGAERGDGEVLEPGRGGVDEGVPDGEQGGRRCRCDGRVVENSTASTVATGETEGTGGQRRRRHTGSAATARVRSRAVGDTVGEVMDQACASTRPPWPGRPGHGARWRPSPSR